MTFDQAFLLALKAFVCGALAAAAAAAPPETTATREELKQLKRSTKTLMAPRDNQLRWYLGFSPALEKRVE